MRLAGKVAIVTGGASGIGFEYAKRFAREGAGVAIFDISATQAESAQRELLAAGHEVMAIPVDVTNDAGIAAAASAVAERFGKIDVLVNNAALYNEIELGNADVEYGQKVMRVNVFGVLLSTWAVVPYMMRRRCGSIIHISSIAAWPGLRQKTQGRAIGAEGEIPNEVVRRAYYYGISKAAVVYLTHAMAGDYGPYNIRVNAIAPGVVMSEATKRLVPRETIEALKKSSVLDCTIEPEELGATAVYLASDESAKMTGQVLVIDGGRKLW
ncbi:MAG TPA: SDR family oxidoreductase [Terriglobales bacterium]|nr:SDR family oxidoreductase [Terriglobales bacterium]